MGKKLLVIAMCLFAAIGLLPSGYGFWSDHVAIQGPIRTGEWIKKYRVYLDGQHNGTYLSQAEAEDAVRAAIAQGALAGHVIEKLSGEMVYSKRKPVKVAPPATVPSTVPSPLPSVDTTTPAPIPAANQQQPISQGVPANPTDPGIPTPSPVPTVEATASVPAVHPVESDGAPSSAITVSGP